MTFEDLIDDLESLIGVQLSSIRAGAELQIIQVDCERRGIVLRTVTGKEARRSCSELRLVWSALRMGKPVHIDSLLRGSGSSRNQPETLLANLPYVEWLMIQRRKHIVFVGESTHEPGTLRKVDPVQADAMRQSMPKSKPSRRLAALVVSTDAKRVASCMAELPGISCIAAGAGTYEVHEAGSPIALVCERRVKDEFDSGTYIVVEGLTATTEHPSHIAEFGGRSWVLLNRRGLRLAAEHTDD